MINKFRNENSFLSNFYPAKVEFDGIIYPTSEHAFQAQKSIDIQMRRTISEEETPGKAKRRGKKIRLRKGWKDIRLYIMREIIIAKFTQNRDLKTKLLATGNEELVEGNKWNDTFWGICNGIGENHLGKILMEVRYELRNQSQKLNKETMKFR